jgi:hypothetical protein
LRKSVDGDAGTDKPAKCAIHAAMLAATNDVFELITQCVFRGLFALKSGSD